MNSQLLNDSNVASRQGRNENGNGKKREETLSLLVCKGFSGEVCRVTLPAHSTITQALSSIADQIGYESPDYEKIGLYNMTQDFEYTAFDQLDESGTTNGDLLIMVDGEACFKD